jgi:hypothetical protein
MTEALGRRWLKYLFKTTNILIQPIESGTTGLGIPDLFIRTERSECWVELKQTRNIKKGIRIDFRPGQLPWIMNYHKLGGRVFLFLFVKTDDDEVILHVIKGNAIKSYYANYGELIGASLLSQKLMDVSRDTMLSILRDLSQ